MRDKNLWVQLKYVLKFNKAIPEFDTQLLWSKSKITKLYTKLFTDIVACLGKNLIYVMSYSISIVLEYMLKYKIKKSFRPFLCEY